MKFEDIKIGDIWESILDERYVVTAEIGEECFSILSRDGEALTVNPDTYPGYFINLVSRNKRVIVTVEN